MIRRFILIGFLFIIYNTAIYCQQKDYIIGKVVNSLTDSPVAFATVRLLNNQLMVITNADGDFRIISSTGFQSDSLIVTCIGFHRLSVAFRMLKKSGMNNFKIVPEINTNLWKSDERKIPEPENIIEKALRDIKKNCPVNQFSFVAYYRDYLKAGNKYLNLNEAIIQVLDKGFAFLSDSSKYRLLDFKKNLDFLRLSLIPYDDLPQPGYSVDTSKRTYDDIAGDQNGNELFILLDKDAIRNYDKGSFSFVDTLTKNFIRNHRFSTPLVINDGNILLYKIDFTAKREITGDDVRMTGTIFIQPDDYSIHQLEYSASYLKSSNKNKEVYNIKIEYEHALAVDSKMCLKYISFSNSFTIPDSSDNNSFKLENTEWRQEGGPYAQLSFPDMTIIAYFNRKVDPVSASKIENFSITIGKRKATITKIRATGSNLFITIRDDKFSYQEVDSIYLNITNLTDVKGNTLNKRKMIELHQFRELFVQDYNDPLEFENGCYIESIPLEQNCITKSRNINRFWMNTPLKGKESK